MLNIEPAQQHAWLRKFVGAWSYEMECSMGPDQPAMKSGGTEVVRPIGGFWVQGAAEGTTPDGQDMTAQMTIGYDPARERFIGTWLCDIMPSMFVYEGTLDASGRVLTLDTEGPAYDGSEGLKRYQDILELVNDDTRELRSRMLGDDGQWHEFSKGVFTRTG